MTLRSFASFAIGLACLAASAGAGTLYGISNGFGTPLDNEIYQINPATGSISNVATVTLPGFTVSNSLALAAHPTSGVLYAVIQTTVGGRRLVTIDPVTGVATLIGTLSTQISTLAFKADGTLLAVSGDGATTNPETLFSVNTSTAALTLLFALGNGLDGETIAMHPSGLLYHSSGNGAAMFESIDLTTQVVTPLGVETSECFAMGYSVVAGQMYLSDINSALFTVNLANGARTLVGQINSISDNRGLAFIEGTPSTPFCTGDAVGTTCLGCGNNGTGGRGCGNSSFANGAQLISTGFASVTPANDTLELRCSNMTGPGLFFQADGLAVAPITFGDGMLCASSGIIRMGVVFPTAGTAVYPGGLTPNPIHIAGAPIAAGNTKHYQCWYRDAGETSPGVSFCTTATFNLSNGISLVWTP
jgi:hypothetical protein